MKRIFQLIFLLCLFSFISSFGLPVEHQSTAQPNALVEIQKRGVLRVGTTGNFPPYTVYKNRGDNFSGFDIDMAKEFAKYLGVKVEFVQTSIKTLGRDLRIGDYDVAMSGLTITPHRASPFLFSNPVVVTGTVPLTRCDNEKDFATLKLINRYGVRVVQVQESPGSDYAKQKLRYARLIETENADIAYKMILDNQADVMLADVVEALYQQKKQKGLCAVNPQAYLTQDDKGYLVNKTDLQLLAKLNEWLIAMRNSGQLDKLAKQWLGV